MVFFVLFGGILAIISAIRYSWEYRLFTGFGDVFVFVFFSW
jgi:hypothetical protein